MFFLTVQLREYLRAYLGGYVGMGQCVFIFGQVLLYGFGAINGSAQ